MSSKASITVSLFLLVATTATQFVAAQSTPEQVDLIALRAEVRQLEQGMYNLFNKFNSSDDLDVHCLEKAPTGSTIPVWQCEAEFMKDVQSRDASSRWDNPGAASANTQNGYIPQSGRQLSFKNRKKAEQLNAEMKTLGVQHPELGSAMLALHAKRQQLEKLEK